MSSSSALLTASARGISTPTHAGADTGDGWGAESPPSSLRATWDSGVATDSASALFGKCLACDHCCRLFDRSATGQAAWLVLRDCLAVEAFSTISPVNFSLSSSLSLCEYKIATLGQTRPISRSEAKALPQRAQACYTRENDHDEQRKSTGVAAHWHDVPLASRLRHLVGSCVCSVGFYSAQRPGFLTACVDEPVRTLWLWTWRVDSRAHSPADEGAGRFKGNKDCDDVSAKSHHQATHFARLVNLLPCTCSLPNQATTLVI